MQNGIYRAEFRRPGKAPEVTIATTASDFWSGGNENFYFFGSAFGPTVGIAWRPVTRSPVSFFTGVETQLMGIIRSNDPTLMDVVYQNDPTDITVHLELLQSFPM